MDPFGNIDKNNWRGKEKGNKVSQWAATIFIDP